MNSLLLEPPRYFNRIYPCITKNLESGIFLDYLIREFHASGFNLVIITEQDFKKEFSFLGIDIRKINVKLNKLPFIGINQNQPIFTYSIDLSKFEAYMTAYNNEVVS